jgi:hypothetical protein
VRAGAICEDFLVQPSHLIEMGLLFIPSVPVTPSRLLRRPLDLGEDPSSFGGVGPSCADWEKRERFEATLGGR